MIAEAASLIGPAVNIAIKLVDWLKDNNNPIKTTEPSNSFASIAEINEVINLVKKAKNILDKPKGHDLEALRNLATKQIKGEVFVDAINFELNTDIKGIRLELENLTRSWTSQQSGNERAGDMPPSHVRRCLLYLHRCHKDHVVNVKRVNRLSTALEFSREDNEPPFLQQLTDWIKVDRGRKEKLADWIEVIDSKLNGDVDEPSHFKIGNAVGEKSKKWPETLFNADDASESTGCIPDGIVFTSFYYLGRYQFSLVKILTLRNVNLKNEEYLKNLPLLRYLNLKHTDVRTCEWLEGLKYLQVLDLRYTMIEEIPHKYLKELKKLQHLLLGYIPNNKAKRLAGATIVGIEKLKTGNLKTLRAVRWLEGFKELDVGRVRNLSDLSVTDFTEESPESFWNVLTNFENLTTLGVSVSEGSVTLEHCPEELKKKLERLKMEGQFDIQSFNGLSGFESLVDLTLAAYPVLLKNSPVLLDPSIKIGTIPYLEKLLCLRLYGIFDEEILKIPDKFNKLKKLVIGDMKKVKTIIIGRAVIGAIDTLKFCDLPMFRELVSLDSGRPILKLVCIGEVDSSRDYEDVMQIKNDKPINIFLRGDYEHLPASSKSKGKGEASSSSRNINFAKSPGVKIYRYDMKKQCYEFQN